VGILDQVGSILKQYENTGTTAGAGAPAETVVSDFDHVATAVPTNTLADGIAHAMRSDQTPQFGQTVSSLFSQANPAQRSAMLSTLVAACGPAASRILGGMSGATAAAGSTTAGSTAAAQDVDPGTVQQLADHAHSADPSIIDKMSGFYAQHPTLVKGLGAAALATVMAHVSKSRQL
jgi:hypothetical protein